MLPYLDAAALAFERVCLQHVSQIKAALGIADVRTSAYGWSAGAEGGRGAQIDLVLARGDRTVNICEMTASKRVSCIDHSP